MATLLPGSALAENLSDVQLELLAGLPERWQARLQSDLQQIENARASNNTSDIANAIEIYRTDLGKAMGYVQLNSINARAQSRMEEASGYNAVHDRLSALHKTVSAEVSVNG